MKFYVRICEDLSPFFTPVSSPASLRIRVVRYQMMILVVHQNSSVTDLVDVLAIDFDIVNIGRLVMENARNKLQGAIVAMDLFVDF